ELREQALPPSSISAALGEVVAAAAMPTVSPPVSPGQAIRDRARTVRQALRRVTKATIGSSASSAASEASALPAFDVTTLTLTNAGSATLVQPLALFVAPGDRLLLVLGDGALLRMGWRYTSSSTGGVLHRELSAVDPLFS